LVERHDREIAPLLHQRWLFAESENFLLYDFYQPDGSVDENVFAYSNRRGEHRALVVYHNRYASTRGTIHHSASYADKKAGHLRQQSLGAAFGLPDDGNLFLHFRDTTTGLEHLERAAKIVSQGFTLELHAYKCHVFVDWRELRPDADHRWDLLCDFLNGRGVRSMEEALLDLEVAPLHASLAALLNPELLESLAQLSGAGEAMPDCGQEAGSSTPAAALLQQVETLSSRFATEALAIYARKTGSHATKTYRWLALCQRVHAAIGLPAIENKFSQPQSREAKMVLPSSPPELHASAIWGPVLACCVLEALAESAGGADAAATALALFDRLRLREPLARAFMVDGGNSEDGWRSAARVRLYFLRQTLAVAKPSNADEFAGFPYSFWDDDDARWLLKVHQVGGEWYFNKELHQQLLWWSQLPDLLELGGGTPGKEPAVASSANAGTLSTVPAVPSLTATEKVVRKAASRHIPSVESIERRVEAACEQTEETGYRLGKRKDPTAKPPKLEKGALAK
jgi:hypothetical protein